MFQSTWGNPQNQQQPTTSAFGQPSAFGTAANTGTSAFGSTSTFGQTQQPPQVNPMFGNLTATPSTNTGTSGFGTFGNNPPSTSAFSASKPATGFGAFSGGTSAFGSGTTPTSGFGQPTAPANTTTTSVFGQPPSTTSTFGGGSNIFGNKSAFGTTPLPGPAAAPPVVSNGTTTPFAVTQEKDGAVTLQFQSITCMPAYAGYSFEELRVQDYAQNRKTAPVASAFGAPSAFSTTQPTNTTSNVFGQPSQQQSATSLFGQNTTNAASGFGTFGQPAATNTNSAFGGGGAFGQTQPQQSAFGTTGTPGSFAQQPQQGSIFGGGGAATSFSNTANKPGFGTFGGGTTGGFGTGTTSTFGNTQPNQPTQGAGLFGSTPAASTTSAFSAFGNNATKPSIFGTATTAQPSTTNAFGGGFGPNQPQQGTSLFGTNTGTSGFGNTQQPNQPPGTSIFGNLQNTNTALTTNPGGGLFGNTQQNQPAQQNPQQQSNPFGNLFSQKPTQPAGAGLFGSTTQPGQPQQSIFGNTFGQAGQNNALFGNKPAAPALGTSMSGNTAMGSSIFGVPTTNGGGQGTLTAYIAQPISENLPIFDMLPPGPRIIDLDQNLPKKKAGFFLDMPTRSPVPRLQLGYTPAASKLRGFGSSGSLASMNASSGISLTSGKAGALTLNKDSRGSSVGPDFLGRSSSPALGSGLRQSVKKVILDKKVEPSDLFIKSGSPGGLKTAKVTFSPQLSVASREKDAQLAAAASIQPHDSPTPATRTQLPQQQTSTGFTATDTTAAAGTGSQEKSEAELREGDYRVKPDLSTLKKVGYDELSSFSNLVVARKGYGEIQFLEPVDLTGLPKLGALLGDVIRFDDKECSVYPDSDDVDKPPPGSGLNVKARLVLERCWANDKATREPIKDPNHPHAVKHLKRLKNMKDTHFESFDMKTGTWTFTVDHF